MSRRLLGIKMGRVLGIDYGKKRCGLAISDPLQIIATPLVSIAPSDLSEWIKNYLSEEQIESIVFGWPTHANGTPTTLAPALLEKIKELKKQFPQVEVSTIDESFSSADARQEMIRMGMKKSQREKKGATDPISAALILRRYLDEK